MIAEWLDTGVYRMMTKAPLPVKLYFLLIAPSGITFELAWEEGGRQRTWRRRVISDRDQHRVELESNSPPCMRHVLFARGMEERPMNALHRSAP